MRKISLTEKRLIIEMILIYTLLIGILIFICLIPVYIGGNNNHELKLIDKILIWSAILIIIVMWNIFSIHFGFYVICWENKIQLKKFRKTYQEYAEDYMLTFGIYRYRGFSVPCLIVSDKEAQEVIINKKGYGFKNKYFVILLNECSWSEISKWNKKKIYLLGDEHFCDYSNKSVIKYRQRIVIFNKNIEITKNQ